MQADIIQQGVSQGEIRRNHMVQRTKVLGITQVSAMVSDVIGLEHGLPGQLVLDAEIPVLNQGSDVQVGA